MIKAKILQHQPLDETKVTLICNEKKKRKVNQKFNTLAAVSIVN